MISGEPVGWQTRRLPPRYQSLNQHIEMADSDSKERVERQTQHSDPETSISPVGHSHQQDADSDRVPLTEDDVRCILAVYGNLKPNKPGRTKEF